MGKVAIVSALSAVLGYTAVYFAFFANPKPTAAPEAPAADAPPEPEVLANVVEMMDPEPLLDARPKKPAGEPFEAVVPAYFTTPAALPVAPAPHEPARSFWYGSHRLPKQIGGGADPAELFAGLRQWSVGQKCVYMPSGVSCGIEFSF